MSILSKLSEAKTSASASTSESIEITIASLSAPINGKYGAFRQFKLSNGATYNVDDARVSNASTFRPNAKATITINTYKNKEGEEKSVVSALVIELPQASGLFVMR